MKSLISGYNASYTMSIEMDIPVRDGQMNYMQGSVNYTTLIRPHGKLIIWMCQQSYKLCIGILASPVLKKRTYYNSKHLISLSMPNKNVL
jgi:hypothetical protein